MEDLEGTGATVGDLTRVLPDDDWLDFLRMHLGIIKCEPQVALKFFANEIIEQMLRRINARYPVTKGYSPVHIALVAVYRAMRAAHNKADEEHVGSREKPRGVVRQSLRPQPNPTDEGFSTW